MHFDCEDRHKMKPKVEIISRDIIKPSSPTASHLKTYKISVIDQFCPNGYVHLLVFYSSNNNHNDPNSSQKLEKLKTSLSETLTSFYPLAGRINKDNYTINCDTNEGGGGGVQVLGARVNCPLSYILTTSKLEELDQLLPREERNGIAPLALQLNMFDCGGIAIGAYINHKIADASSLCFFLNSWASCARGDDIGFVSPCPVFDGASMFLPKDQVPMINEIYETEEKLVSRKFVFDAPMIAALKAKAINKNPSRVMAVTAFLWRIAMAVESQKPGHSSKPSIMEFSVNLRGRMEPPLPEYYFGNLFIVSTMASGSNEYELLENLREVLSRINSDYIRKLQFEDEFMKIAHDLANAEDLFMKGEAVRYTVSSWCGFPFYEVDFGWGKPIWATTSAVIAYKNLFLLMDTRTGEGVEALVVLDEEDMAKFTSHSEFLEFFSSTCIN